MPSVGVGVMCDLLRERGGAVRDVAARGQLDASAIRSPRLPPRTTRSTNCAGARGEAGAEAGQVVEVAGAGGDHHVALLQAVARPRGCRAATLSTSTPAGAGLAQRGRQFGEGGAVQARVELRAGQRARLLAQRWRSVAAACRRAARRGVTRLPTACRPSKLRSALRSSMRSPLAATITSPGLHARGRRGGAGEHARHHRAARFGQAQRPGRCARSTSCASRPSVPRRTSPCGHQLAHHVARQVGRDREAQADVAGHRCRAD